MDAIDGIERPALLGAVADEFAVLNHECSIQEATASQPRGIHHGRAGVVSSGYGESINASRKRKRGGASRKDSALDIVGK